MKTSLFKLQLLLIALLLGFNSGRAQDYTYYRTVAMFVPDDINDEGNEQEKAALDLFNNTTFEGNTEKKLIYSSNLDDIKYPNIDCLWIHIDRKGLNEGVSQLPEAYRNPEFINKVREFHKNGGNLYLSKFAVQLLFPDGIDRLPAYLKPNVFNSVKEDDKGDIWSINAEIGAKIKDPKNPNPQYIDQTTHPIYAGLTTLAHNEWPASPDHIYDANPYRVFPMQGKSNHETIHREDHNCMWRVAFKSNDNAKLGIYTGFEGVHSWADLYTKDGDKWVETEKCKEIKAAAPQELAALYFMLCPDSELYKKRPGVHVEVICPGDIARIKDYANFDCIWIHIDRCGLDRGFDKLPEAYRRADLIEALTGYCKDGRALLLTKQATQLIPELGRIGKDFAPNIFGSADGGKGTDVWTLNAQIGWWQLNPLNQDVKDPSQYYDRRNHAIYNDMRRGTDWFTWETFPMEGTGNGSEMWREDHNCMWNLNGFSYSADGKNTVEKFENQHHATVLGTWGHVQDYAVAAIIEFRPTPDFRGRIIANGLAAYELAPREGGNAFQDNLELLTFNCLSYLCTVTDFRFVNDGPNGVVRFQSDANATVLGTWGQDWNHQAAGIVEFHPTAATYAAGDDDPASLVEVNKNKAARGSVIANGIACVQLYHDDNNKNDFQGNVNKLTVNAMDYLTPWHSRIALGVENVSGDSAKGKVSASEGRLAWTGFNAPVLLEVYSVDGSLLRSMMIEGEGSADIDARGIVVINAGGSVCKAIL